MSTEYLGAVRHFPLAIAAVKLAAFRAVAGFDDTHLFFYFPQIDHNDLGLASWHPDGELQNAWAAFGLDSAEDPVWRLLFATHWIWMAIGVAWLFLAAVRPARRRLALVLLLPLAYHASYLLAAPAADYRLMYPATLVLQVMMVAWLLGLVASALRRSTAAARSRSGREAG